MQLEALAVVNIPKRNAGLEVAAEAAKLRPLLLDAFCMESCQRWLWVTTVSQISQISILKKLKHPAIQIMRDRTAYDFMLRVATGLESAVVGETDIFGQLKEAWKQFADTGSPLVGELNPWFQRLFEDTKEIRSQYLHDLGGASYGSLVRKVLHNGRSACDQKRESVLVIGAGQIAQSIAPWLLEYDLLIWNRSPEKLRPVVEELKGRPGNGYRLVIGEEEEKRAWMQATHVVMCIPLDAKGDARRIEWWKEGLKKGYKKGHIIHLGGLREQCHEWLAHWGVRASAQPAAEFHALDDLFQLKGEQDAVRSRHIRLARIACSERARLRVLGGLSVPHGWEDLIGFASERELALSWTY